MYFLSRKMATERIGFPAGAVQNEEYTNSTWNNEPLSFARCERCCVTLHKRENDDTLETTKRAVESVIALMVGDKLSHRLSWCRHWEQILFVFALVLQQEERQFNSIAQDETRLCGVDYSAVKMMGKAFTSVLRHKQKYAGEMNENAALPLNTLLDSLGNDVSPLCQQDPGRVFAAFLCGNDKQRFFLDIYSNDTWYPDENPMAWSI